MICKKCGKENIQGAKFCANCGQTFEIVNPTNVSETPVAQAAPVSQPVSNVQTVQVQAPVQVQPQAPTNIATAPSQKKGFNYFKYIIMIFAKPFKNYSDNKEELSKANIAIILSVIVLAIAYGIGIVKGLISASIVERFNSFTLSYQKTFDFSNISTLTLINAFVVNLFVYAGEIAGLAVIYFLFAMAFKKKQSYPKFLSVVATAMVPYIATSLVLSPVVKLLWIEGSTFISFVGLLYSLLLLIYLIDDVVGFEKNDMKIYYHLICLAIGYFVYLIYYVVQTISIF